MAENQSTPRSVSLYPDEWEFIEELAKTSGVKTVSAAIRLLINELRMNRFKPLEVENVTAN